LACRYLAARCLVKQDKWEEALDMLGEENPWRGGQLSGKGVRSDGGIKVCVSLLLYEGTILWGVF
jgi:anaphase-promoting complex subunit 6